MDRTKAPEFRTIEKIEIPHAEKHSLDNGIEVYSINAGSQELTKIEFLFKAGMYYQDRPLMAATTNSLLETGTKKYTADQLSDEIDFFGSFFECSVGQDYSSVVLYSLNKYLENTIGYVEDILKNATFPQNEFDIYISNKKQKFLVNTQKVNVIARRRFGELIFGEKHPYGIDVKLEDYDKLKRDDVVGFYQSTYNSSNCAIIVSGNIPSSLIKVLNEHFGKQAWGSKEKVSKGYIAPAPSSQQKHFIERADAIQSALRVGRLLFNKKHEDYFTFQVLNTILGGYFGSRLMANIREDKGYTYGIGSGVSSLVNGGYFYISTEVGADVTGSALEEIYKEIKILRDVAVPEEELETVRNYILGQFLRSVDGPFSLADKFKGIWEFGLDYDYYQRYFDVVKHVTPAQLQEAANKYLQEKDLLELVVGKK
ncbi:MAG: M16 family metallopeptidase [Bacteroidia bacterium]